MMFTARLPSLARLGALALALSLMVACGSGDDESAPATASDPAASDPAATGPGASGDVGTAPGTGDTAPIQPPPPPFEPDARVGAITLLSGTETDPSTRVAYTLTPAAASPPAGTIVLLHDFGNSSLQMQPLAQRLAQTHTIITPDLRGHGNSATPACCFALADLAGDLEQLLQTVAADPVHLVASGGGGFVAQAMAVSSPNRIASLTLIATDSTAIDNALWQSLSQQAAAFDPALVASEGVPADFLAQWNGQINPGLQAALAPAQARVPARVWRETLAIMGAGDVTAALPAIAAPTLLLHGDRDPLFAPATQTRLANGLIREVRLTLPNVGRWPDLVAPQSVASIISRFVAPRGSLHAVGEPTTRTRDQIDALTADGIERLLLRDVTGKADCQVEIRRIEYQTVGAAGESTNATANIAVPVGDGPVCNGERPLLLYAHGSSPEITYDTATSSEVFGGVVLAAFAARGYMVVAPNYTGYQGSWLDYHPYLIADAQADDMIDALRASRRWLASQTRVVPKSLFLSGYSQGGYVAMATHRRMQRDHADEFRVAASFPMSGPYSLDQTVAEILDGRLQSGGAQVLALTIEGYQRAYRDIFTTPSDLFEPPYDQTALGIFPGFIGTGAAVEQGLLPGNLLARQGSPHLMRQSYVEDFQTNPDNPLRQAFARNTLLDWAPDSPMAMCGGGKDQTVFFDNTYRTRTAFFANGADVPYFDFNDSTTLPGGVFNSLYLRFRSIFLIGNDDAYHVALGPFCMRLARDFFNQYQ